MIAFDADIVSLILRGDPVYVERTASIPSADQTVPVIVVEEIMRGWLNAIRQAESGNFRGTIDSAYLWFELTFVQFRSTRLLSYTAEAEILFQSLRSQRIRVGTRDLRIAATCIVHQAKLISRNRRDFELVPGLSVDFWD